MSTVIEIRQLSKTYKQFFKRTGVVALYNVSLAVQEGEIFGLLGLNGAGKSTLIKILLNLVRPTSGEAFLFGKAVTSRHLNNSVGYLPELFSAAGTMNAMKVLQYLGELSGLRGKSLASQIEKNLQRLGLADASSQKLNTFSKGMILRLGIAQALLHSPRLLFLDEPTEGLDPDGRRLIRALLMELSANGVTILLNAHALSEIELVAHRIGILHKGRLVAEGKISDLMPRDQRLEIRVSSNPGTKDKWLFQPQGPHWVLEVEASELPQLASLLGAKSIPILAVRPIRTTLEDVFFSFLPQNSTHEHNNNKAHIS
ncbi:MAG: ABC transporter ATP-binding protein [Ignavibacteriales bacterium]|nr:ABC transporter ATP-binding protein [Ignavibacteriales bacterium]MBI3788282.1 ABC transporter ATP-binding protein [Ignavibacteriales bacterium]